MASENADLPDDVPLLRRIPPWHIKEGRPTSAAFKSTKDDGDAPEAQPVLCFDDSRRSKPIETLKREPVADDSWGVTTTETLTLRREGLRVRPRPTLLNKAHVEAEGDTGNTAAKRLRKASPWALAPKAAPSQPAASQGPSS